MFDYAAHKFKPRDVAAWGSIYRGLRDHHHRVPGRGGARRLGAASRDVIGPGDVQWMTAGARHLIHEEFHATAFAAGRAATFEMAQL